VFSVLKDDKGKWMRNPQIITDAYVKEGDLVYGEYKAGDEFKQARELVNNKLKNNEYDFALLDTEVDRICWTFANLFPGCLIMSIDGIRNKKKFFWDQTKNTNRHWLAANMMGEAFLGSVPSTQRRLLVLIRSISLSIARILPKAN